MSTMTPVRGTDIDAWREGRVPPDVKQAIGYIYFSNKAKIRVTWADVADFMEWNCHRSELRGRMKRLRRWGVRWDMNKEGSTRIDKLVWEFIEAEAARSRA